MQVQDNSKESEEETNSNMDENYSDIDNDRED